MSNKNNIDEEISEIVEDTNCLFNSGKIRNPERIEPICDALKEHWMEHPDLRLGQLVCNLSASQETFFVEDTVMIYELDAQFNGDLWVDKDE